jgi:hypothetical protein
MISLNAYSDLLATLYSTSLDVRWQTVLLDKICEYTQSTQSHSKPAG